MKTAQIPHLTLNFWKDEKIELVSSSFYHPLLAQTHRTNRGRGRSAFRGSGSFEWTKAVQALVVLFLQAALGDDGNADLIGGQSSLASSLDYAIDKQPCWMTDMFGNDQRGNTLLKRAIIRNNPGRKRVGPVALSLNRQFLNPTSIGFSLNSEAVTDAQTLLALQLEIYGQVEILRHSNQPPFKAEFNELYNHSTNQQTWAYFSNCTLLK